MKRKVTRRNIEVNVKDKEILSIRIVKFLFFWVYSNLVDTNKREFKQK